tara:strand:+ start:592 stop:1077 length:486 start_codon:yes stop_codon:yes gene_type:complete
MTLKKILIINTVLVVFACLAHIPTAIMSITKVSGFESLDPVLISSLAIIDIILLSTCVIGFIYESKRLKVISFHAIAISLLAIWILSMVLKIAVFGIPEEGNYSFSFGLTTALCVYSVYLLRRIYVEYNSGNIRKYHWYVAGLVGLAEVAMFVRVFRHMFS